MVLVSAWRSPVSICMCVSFHCGLVSEARVRVPAHLENLHTFSSVRNQANSWHAAWCTTSVWGGDFLTELWPHPNICDACYQVLLFCVSLFWLRYYREAGWSCDPQGEWLLVRRSQRVTRSTDVRLAAPWSTYVICWRPTARTSTCLKFTRESNVSHLWIYSNKICGLYDFSTKTYTDQA